VPSAVVNLQELAEAQFSDARADGVTDDCGWIVERPQSPIPEPAGEIDVFEPSGEEALVEASGGQKRIDSQCPRGRRRLFDTRARRRLGGGAERRLGPHRHAQQVEPAGEPAQLPAMQGTTGEIGHPRCDARSFRVLMERVQDRLETRPVDARVGVQEEQESRARRRHAAVAAASEAEVRARPVDDHARRDVEFAPRTVVDDHQLEARIVDRELACQRLDVVLGVPVDDDRRELGWALRTAQGGAPKRASALRPTRGAPE
jgi:hypothetical protein